MGKTVAVVVGVVAAVVIAVAAPYLAGLILAPAASAFATAVVTAAIGTALALGASFAFRAMGIGAVPSSKNAGVPQIFRQSITDSFIAYGKRRLGGLLVFFHPKKVGNTHFRYFVIACAGHRCKGAVTFKLNDEEVTVDGDGMVTSGKYRNGAWLWFKRGTDSDTANATFVAETDGKWTANHRGLDVAAIEAKFELTDDIVQAGLPNITAVVEGRDEIFDTRDGIAKYTRNGALVFYDWMSILREEGGFGAYDDEIPDEDWISAQANVCDEVINGNPRYALDAVLTTGSPPGEVRDALVVNMAGRYTYSAGKHLMRPGYWVPVSITLEEVDLAGPIQVSPFFPPDFAANEVQGTYINPEGGYQGAPFTTQTSSDADIKQMDLDLAFTTVLDQANRVASIMKKRAEAEKSVVWPMNCVGIGVAAIDTVRFNTPRYGLSNYAFNAANWGLSSDYNVVIKGQEDNEDIYGEPAPIVPVTPPTPGVADPVLTLEQIQAILRDTYPRFNGSAMTANESGGAASITIPNFDLDYVGTSYGTVPVTGTTLTGLLPGVTYYPYIDVDGPGDGTPTFGATTSYGTALNSSTHPFRIYLLQAVPTPASGSGGSSSGSGTGGGYGGGNGTVIP